MKILVTGSAGHLGEGLMRTLRNRQHEVVGTDIKNSEFTDVVGNIVDRGHVRACMQGVDAVLHTATLHKPHIATHSRQEFVDTNVTGTLNLLEESVANGVKAFIFTSTTSAFGDALTPSRNLPAAWITEEVVPIPKNIYGVTKIAAENLCQLFFRNQSLPCVVLRTSRFFPEEDDKKEVRETFDDTNLKVNEILYRRVDLQDVVDAQLLAIERAPTIGFGRYIISATTPFTKEALSDLRTNAPNVLERLFPDYVETYGNMGWRMFPGIDRVYSNELARNKLGWRPNFDFSSCLSSIAKGEAPFSELSCEVGSKGYHDQKFEDGPFPVDLGQTHDFH